MTSTAATAEPADARPGHSPGTPIDARTDFRPGVFATLTRMFGWGMLAVLGAYLINMILTTAAGWPGVAALFDGEANARSALQLALYVGGAALAILWTSRHRDTPLRVDSERVSAINTYLVRAAFFGVLFVGLGDTAVSFLRVEGLLEGVVGEEMTRELGRSRFRGLHFHVPLLALGFVVAAFTRTLGFVWLALLIVAAELLIVITRFIFSYEQAFMGDLVRFWYAALFLFASAYTLKEEGHVRVDVFYAGLGRRTKGVINAIGSVFLGMALCWTILIVGLGSRTSIIYAPIRSFETSQSGYGMYVKYLMAGFLGVFAVTMLIQFVSYLMGAVADIVREPGGDPDADPAAGDPAPGDPAAGDPAPALPSEGTPSAHATRHDAPAVG